MLSVKLGLRPALLVLLAATAACGGIAPQQTDPSVDQPGVQPPGSPPPPTVACALPAAPTVSTLATGTAIQGSIATSSSNVFWSQGGSADSTLYRAAKAGGGAVAMPGAGGHVVAADDAAVYVVTGAGNGAGFGIDRVPLDGSAKTTIVSDSTAITAVAIDDARVYWGASGSVGDCFSDTCPVPTPSLQSAPKTGGAPTTLGAFTVTHLHVDGDLLYYGNQVAGDLPGAPKTSVGAMPKTGGALVSLASRPGMALSDIVIDSTNVYWAESDLTDKVPTAIMTVPRAGGTPALVATMATRDPGNLALDAANVYWLDDQTQSLMRAPKSGGAASVVIGDQVTSSKFGGFGALTADASGLYWVADTTCGQDCASKIVSLAASCR